MLGLMLGAVRRLYFENDIQPAAGHLIFGGEGSPQRMYDWWNLQELHSLPHYYLSLLLKKGSGCYRDENGFTSELSHGHFVLLTPGLRQHFGPSKGEYWDDLHVSFNGRIFDIMNESGFIKPIEPVWRLADPIHWATRLRQILKMPRPSTEKNIVIEASQFLTFLLEMQASASPEKSGQAGSDWFTGACLMLTRDLSQKIDLHQVAGELGMSYHTFRLYFTRRAGMPPGKYRNTQRVKAACNFLQTTNKTCREIAFHFGYGTEQRFSMDFKKINGLTPSDFRKRHKAESIRKLTL